ncbi:MAG TPA: NAD-dependent epimerase/dehydratase family protein, partial [Anaerolineae bacterium]|nr:NAD-dependent epimerase/dehydratase family protein [Anaerolineae bacterium]
MKIVVTGAAGFIGSHLAEALADLGHEVVGIDCLTDYYAPALKRLNAADIAAKGVRLLELDLAEDDLATAVQDADFVYHLAGQPGISATTPYEIYVRNNMHATHRLLKVCADLPSLRCFVNIATSSVYGKYATSDEETAPRP